VAAVTGPEHYREGERLLSRCHEFTEGERRTSLATEANAHFLAALVASHATSAHPESTSWAKVIQP